MTNTEVTTDPRFNETGTGAYREIKSALRDHLGQDTAAALGLESQGLVNQGWRPSDALRKCTRDHLANVS